MLFKEFVGIRFAFVDSMRNQVVKKSSIIPANSYSVLIIEDEPTFSRLMEFVLTTSKDYRFNVRCVESAEEAFGLFSRGDKFDVILLDYFLPGKNGEEFLEDLKKYPLDPAVICVSISQEYKIAADMIKAGADDFLCKEELDKNRVLEKSISTVLKKREYRHKIAELEITNHRLDAITTIIRTVHHELNNPMTILNLIASVLQTTPEISAEAMRSYSLEITRTIERMNEVLHKLHKLEGEVLNTELRGPKIYSISREE
jgi:DNA-binding NarL/FixJ family response regulator